MGNLPPLPMLLASVSADYAKLFLDRHGWDKLTALLRKHNLVPKNGRTLNLATAGAFVANGIMDWHMAESTPLAKFAKEILRDIPSEMAGRLRRTTPSAVSPDEQHPLYGMDRQHREALLARYRTMDHSTQNRLRAMLAGLREDGLTVLATATSEDMATLMDLLAPRVRPAHSLPLAHRIAAALDGITESLFPFMGQERNMP